MEIERDIINDFREWKSSPNHKPILLQGARQVGKTWAMLTFGQEFDYCVKFDFARQPDLKSAFQVSKSPAEVLKQLQLLSGQPIIAGRTLVIFDEIQECEEALNSLKYFNEEMPGLHIIAAGSLLGVAVKHKKMSVPVGKVRVMRMFPITFREFLRASAPRIYDYIDGMTCIEHLPVVVLNQLNREYRRYQVSGGMPEAVKALLGGQGMDAVDEVLQDILDLYELDFSRYASAAEIPRIHAIWHSLPSQLAKENRKFIYKVVRSGARSKDYEDALMWLEDAGMIHRIYSISKPGMPISAYADPTSFKVYACDCGLLRQLSGISSSVILNPIANYTEFKGAMAENAVLVSLLPQLRRATPYYWTSGRTAEVEFVIQAGEDIIPVEVKAEDNINGKSLGIYNNKYAPKFRIRFSSLNLQTNGGMLSSPAGLAGWTEKWLKLMA